jgi:hypothetical protein
MLNITFIARYNQEVTLKVTQTIVRIFEKVIMILKKAFTFNKNVEAFLFV